MDDFPQLEAEARKNAKPGDAYFYFSSYNVPTEYTVVRKTRYYITLDNHVQINIATGRDAARDAWAHHRYLPDCPHVRTQAALFKRTNAAKKTFDHITYELAQRFDKLDLDQREALNLELQRIWRDL